MLMLTSHMSLSLFIFIQVFFSVSDWISFVDLSLSSLVFSSAISNLILNPSSECFISVIIIFNLRISFLKKIIFL